MGLEETIITYFSFFVFLSLIEGLILIRLYLTSITDEPAFIIWLHFFLGGWLLIFMGFLFHNIFLSIPLFASLFAVIIYGLGVKILEKFKIE